MLSPIELAAKLGILPPTPEQAEVIEAGLEPMVVMAGAGSGKSETMAGRVVWLVANGLVRPEQVLGLTFTRKAAAELSVRVRERLSGLVAAGQVPAELLEGEPTISTYHAYAARLVTDHALREALEPTMRLISPAVAWQLAGHVVSAYDGPMEQIEWGPATVTRAVLELSGELSEHLRTPQDVREVGAWLAERYAALPGTPVKDQRRPLVTQRAREQLLPLVEAYERLKRRREVIDHGDQMALAARIAARHPDVGAIERGRFAVVLLDEYQDTSHAQLVLLRSLFGGGHPVTAVGDPCQSIYGWRGASAGNLSRFPRDFTTPSGEPAPVRRLSVSFRNGDAVLDVAARLQLPLRMEAREVPVLVPGGNRVGRGRVVCAFHETADAEAEWVAAGIATLLGTESAPDGLPWAEGERRKAKQSTWGGPQALQPHDIAILARKRAQFPALRRALEARGIPVEVVGLGGLLTVPEVADIVATLRVIYDPGAGDALVRLLSGPRWRIGPADLKELGERARELNRETREGTSPVADPLDQVVADLAEERGSLVDALDELPDRPEWQDLFSPLARVRLVAMAQELRLLRAHAGQPLPDLILEIERRLGLDIEVAARGVAVGPFAARADLDAFLDAAARFAGDSEDPTLGAFLAFLKAADEEENGLDAGRVGESNSVKLMTVHASKGLEWPVVVVPGLSQALSKAGALTVGTVFPARPTTSPRWTENPRKLPYQLRGDASDLPVLPGLAKEELAEFDERCRDRDLLEERRLAYVAVTRAHYLLIASGYRWGSAARPLEPSDFLLEIRDTCGRVSSWAPELEDGAVNPLLAEPAESAWPVTPDDVRYAAVLDGATLVESALAALAGSASRPDTGSARIDPARTGPALRHVPDDPWEGDIPFPDAPHFSDAPDIPNASHFPDIPNASHFPDAPDGDPSFPGDPWDEDVPFPEAPDDDVPPPTAPGQAGQEWLPAAGGVSSPDDPGTAGTPFPGEKGVPSPADPGGSDDPADPGDGGVPSPGDPRERRSVPVTGELRGWDRERVNAWERDIELLLRERELNRRRGPGRVELPAHLTVSALVTLASDPKALARQIRRPVPKKPAPLARRGTSFHQWLESRWGQQRLLDEFELPGASDEVEESDARLEELRERFEESEWAGREPLDVEVAFETIIADRVVRGRMDAVFQVAEDRYEVVDWKTGRRPRGGKAEAAAAVQLAAYRLAWSHLAGVPLEQVSAAFHYVLLNETVRPVNLLDERGLVALVESVPAAR
ncbi:DNA helicase-2/ATP-dependent DNA helicase PcrA [Streptosporangium becharense]|uniref:DNA 3'-5' helicase n=1 Tax=Streptosporangium becharense TaxID=1816182 RepID=A0A7W9IIC0_9ACTN|nr:UvrD-helicase domain-containing protein [Streptosporangium becharense]MBB2913548.1 DNA helicase-2/ATP-dependent DNA helicase PcrA [Streptosporangium becharense]MBB5821238.1 DNA helicase-2/ATP-dependent DNA helicase PcrA [Streptosporangium becharense]